MDVLAGLGYLGGPITGEFFSSSGWTLVCFVARFVRWGILSKFERRGSLNVSGV